MINSAGLVSSEIISKAELLSFFKTVQQKPSSQDCNAVGIMGFFEASTRTRVSFERAGLDLGVRWIHISPEDSSLQKGESLEDTFKTLSLYRPDFFVVRHSSSGFAHLVHRWTGLPVFNAGDGMRDHPTQGLIDSFTLWSRSATKKYRIAFFGDAARSRVARSDIHFFRLFGYDLHLVDDSTQDTRLFAKAFKLKLISRAKIKKMDIVVCLRVQHERGSRVQYEPLALKDLGSKTLLMHPGPALIGIDLKHELADFGHARSLVHTQVENGLRIRRALISLLLSKKEKSK